MPQPGSQPPYPPYSGVNIGQQGYPSYPPSQPGYPPQTGQPGYPQQSSYPTQPGYPQQNPYPSQIGQYPPQQPGQFPQSGSFTSNPSMFPSSAMQGQYPPQSSPYPAQQPLGYPQQSAYPPAPSHASSVYPNITTGNYGGSSQIPSQAVPISSSAHYQPLGSSPTQKKVRLNLFLLNVFCKIILSSLPSQLFI